MENNVQPVKSLSEVEVELKTAYSKKLQLDIKIPDPLKIIHGWKDEEEGLCFWPTLLYPDIFNYLMFYPSELGSKDLSDYKTSKAYSYYKSGWLQPLLYHDLAGSNYCILKGDCRKSQNIKDPFHKFWIIIEKNSSKIKCCHCSCVAGMSQTCNHVAAAMYRIEAAVRNGLTNPACTSKPSEWLPNRTEVVPMKVKDIDFSREDFAAKGKKKRPFKSEARKLYNPVRATVKALQLKDVAEALEDIAPDSIIFTAVPKAETDFVDFVVEPPVITCKCINDVLLSSVCPLSFKMSLLEMGNKDIEDIEVLSRGQSANSNWFEFRKGVITASTAHDVITKMRKVQKGGGGYTNMWSLNQNISKLTYKNFNCAPMKYGREMEVNDVNTFHELVKGEHFDLKLEDCRLFLHKKYPFIGGSPDRIIKCKCCPPACLEVSIFD